jgi:uncharacterized membrane protein YidH (DUF202 family)
MAYRLSILSRIDMPKPKSTLLSVTHCVVWVCIAADALLTIGMIVGAGVVLFGWHLFVEAFGKHHSAIANSASRLELLGVFLIGAGITVAVFAALNRLRLIIITVRYGDPFVPVNAQRLRAIGWIMLLIQVAGIPFLDLSHATLSPHPQQHLLTVHSLNGLLAILLVFVLAGIFEQASAMRTDLEGTV